ncbi:MAG: methyl-accepting chemotaxis protein [Ignavibacteriaceae bacterium]
MKILGKIKKSIRLQIISSVTLILVFIVAFVSLYYPAKQKSSSITAATAQVKTLSEMLAFSVGMGLGESNFDLVQTTFKWAQRDKNVTYILIQDESNSEIISYNPENLQIASTRLNDRDKITETGDAITTSTTIKYKDTKLGKIVLVYSLEEVNTTVASDAALSISISLGIFAAGLFLIMWLTKIIINKIKKLNEAVQEVASGNLDVNMDINSEDEVGVLASSFKKMTQSIKDANEMLNKEKDGIALKVEEAVSESENQKLYLSQSIETILAEMNKFAEGDLTVSLKAEKDDEIGKLFNGFNRSVSNINMLIRKVTESVEATASASTQISSSMEENATGLQEQSAQTSETAASIEEMTKTILETTRNASAAAENAKKAGDIAGIGGKAVNDTVKGMERIAQVVMGASSTIKQLGNSSDQIGEIIQVIDDIADQTNLLALNAAIEAARAGEQGRGFAVVADEVRKLAERTTKATKEIAVMIKQIQNDTGEAVQKIDEGTTEVNNGKVLANKAGESLKEIINATIKVVDDVTQVATASEEQSATAEQISRNIEAISNVTNESSMGMQQISRATEDLSRLTDNLQNLVSKFKVDAEDNHEHYSVRQNGKLIVS